MKISIISGSNRKNSQSIKISKIYFEKLNSLDATVNLISLENERLPFWEDDFEGYIPPYKEAFKADFPSDWTIFLSFKADPFSQVIL